MRPARRLSPLTPVLKGPIVFLAILGGAWQQFLNPEARTGAGFFVVMALFAGVAAGIASWLRTTYWIDERELRIDTGLLSRQSRRIRIDRLQGVDIVQPFVARVFGHAQLNFDVAGGDTEGSLAFLRLAEAEEVRSLLLERRNQLRREQGPDDAPAAGDEAEPPERELARLDLGLLALSTVLSLEMLVFVVGAGLTVATVVAAGSLAAGVGIALPAVLGGGIALFRQVNNNHGHVVTESRAGLVLRRGLFSRSRQTVQLHRIQGVRISEPILWRRFGWARLEISVAGAQAGGEQRSLTSSVLMPVAPLELVRELAVTALRGLDVYDVPLTPVPRRARWRAPVSFRWQALGADARMAVSRRGFLTRRTDAAPTGRVQSLAIVQGPWSRALRLADVEVHSPVGVVRVVGRFRGEAEARAFFDRMVVDTRGARVRHPTPPNR